MGVKTARCHAGGRDKGLSSSKAVYGGRARLKWRQKPEPQTGWMPGEHNKFYEYPHLHCIGVLLYYLKIIS